MTLAVILGSAFGSDQKESKGGRQRDVSFEAMTIDTRFGQAEVHRVKGLNKEAFAIFRHGRPHRFLPNQVNYRAQALALKSLGVSSLLITSSVGVMDENVPLYTPLLVSDLLMPENRLPDGSACTLFDAPSKEHGHLVLSEGLFSKALNAESARVAKNADIAMGDDVVFAYVGGPRTKTKAENRYWAQAGAQVNSMTLGPEVVLANECEISCSAIVVGHKYSVPGKPNPPDGESLAETLVSSKEASERLVYAWLENAQSAKFANHIFRFPS